MCLSVFNVFSDTTFCRFLCHFCHFKTNLHFLNLILDYWLNYFFLFATVLLGPLQVLALVFVF